MKSLQQIIDEMESLKEMYLLDSKSTVNEYNKGLYSGVAMYITSLIPQLKLLITGADIDTTQNKKSL